MTCHAMPRHAAPCYPFDYRIDLLSTELLADFLDRSTTGETASPERAYEAVDEATDQPKDQPLISH